MALAAVMTQTLIPRTGGGMIPAAELLIVGYGARQHIRKNALQHLHQEITITRKQGSFTLEESLTELTAMGQLPRFMRSEYGISVPKTSLDLVHETSVYTRWTDRMANALRLAGNRTDRQVFTAARTLADATPTRQRIPELALRIAVTAGGPGVSAASVRRIQDALTGFINEKDGTRTALRQAVADAVDGREPGRST